MPCFGLSGNTPSPSGVRWIPHRGEAHAMERLMRTYYTARTKARSLSQIRLVRRESSFENGKLFPESGP